MRLVERHQEPYLRAHPLAFWFSAAVALSGVIQLLAPGLVAASAISVVLPPWLKFIFSVSYAVGGALSLVGILRGKAKWEAAGMGLIASVLTVQFAAAIHYLGVHVLGSAILTFMLAIGCYRRSAYLAKLGYKIEAGHEEVRRAHPKH